MDDAAFPAPLNSALPIELDPDRAGSRLRRDMVRAGDVTGRSCSVLNREVRSPVFKRSIRLRLAPEDSKDLAELWVLKDRLGFSRLTTSPLFMIALLPLPLIILERTPDRTSEREEDCTAAAC